MPHTRSTHPRARSPRRLPGAIALVDALHRRRRRARRPRRQGRAATPGARDGSISPARTRRARPPAAPPRVSPPRRRRLVRRGAWGWTTVGVSADYHRSAAGSKEAREGEGTASRGRNRSPMPARAMRRALGRAMSVGRRLARSGSAVPGRTAEVTDRCLQATRDAAVQKSHRAVRDAPGAAARPRPRRAAPPFASRIQASPRRFAGAPIRARASRRRVQCAPLRQAPVGTVGARSSREFRN